MNCLEERIIKDGIVKEGNVLKVESFIHKCKNHYFIQPEYRFDFNDKGCRFVIYTGTVIMVLARLFPVFGALFATLPDAVLGGCVCGFDQFEPCFTKGYGDELRYE